jgi:hypothetical protein
MLRAGLEALMLMSCHLAAHLAPAGGATLARAARRLKMRRPMSSQARHAPRTDQFKACNIRGGNR